MPKHKPILRRKFDVPIYPCAITLVVVKDPDAFVEEMYKNATPPTSRFGDTEGEARCACEWPSFLLVVKPKAPVAVVTHEIGHIARDIMSAIGFKIDSCNDEPLAYLESWITDKVFKILKSQKT